MDKQVLNDRIDQLVRICASPNFDSSRGVPVYSECGFKALQFVQCLPPNIQQPGVDAAANGSIRFRCERMTEDGRSLTVNVHGNGLVVYRVDHPFRNDATYLPTWHELQWSIVDDSDGWTTTASWMSIGAPLIETSFVPLLQNARYYHEDMAP